MNPNFNNQLTKTFILHPIATAIRWNSKQVWKGLGCGEGKNLSLKGFPFPASKFSHSFKHLVCHACPEDNTY